MVTKIQLKIKKIELTKKGKFHLSLKYDFDEFLILIISEKTRNNTEKLKAVGSNKTPKSKKIFPLCVSLIYFFNRFV